MDLAYCLYSLGPTTATLLSNAGGAIRKVQALLVYRHHHHPAGIPERVWHTF